MHRSPELEGKLDMLAGAGINLLAFSAIDDASQWPLARAWQRGDGILLLFACGPGFAAQLDLTGNDADTHPFDRRSFEIATDACQQLRAELGPGAEVVYPHGPSVDLRRHAYRARAQYPSPLGTGVRPDCGPWLSVRAAVACRPSEALLAAILRRHPPLDPDPGASPCSTCSDQPCISTCPARALAFGPPPVQEIERCIEHRLQPNSGCALRCDARLACPVGRAQAYPASVLRHHYRASLTTIRRWVAERSAHDEHN